MKKGGFSFTRGNAALSTIAFLDWHWLGRKRIWIALIAATFVAFATFHSGISIRADDLLRTTRETILNRPASGEIHILEIDAKSIAAIDSWPWPRRVHGDIVDRLAAAGADTIAFDVDFSSPSAPEEDRRFAEALRRFDGTILLPTFVQQASGNDRSLTENVPIDILREHAFLASVNVQPDRSGVIRNFGYGVMTEGVARPGMAAVLAEAKGDIGASFRVDTSIDPASLPRHSVIDLLNGKLEPGSLKGKSVFIGATAIELGDRYAMPRHGVQPGVVIQALAAETLIQRADFSTLDQRLSLYIALLFAALAASRRFLRDTLLTGGAGLIILNFIPLGLEYFDVGTVDIFPGIVSLLTTTTVCIILYILGRFDHLRMVDTETGFANELAMTKALTVAKSRFVIVMRIENFSDVAAKLGKTNRALALQNIAKIIKLGTGDAEVYRVGKGTLAWLSSAENIIALTESIDGLHAVLASRIAVNNDQIVINPYFGIAPGIEIEPVTAIVNAGLAAHQAAQTGTKWSLFNEKMSSHTDYVQHVLSGLDDAIADRHIYLLYQPKWSLREARICGVEALIRWNHSELGPISPAEFIPVLEQNNQMSHVTEHIARVCGELAHKWHAAGIDCSISMNISAPLFMDDNFNSKMLSELTDLGEARRLIMFEITESAAVTNDREVIAALQKFREIGVRISIDDYGTGQSTLSYLQKFPADEIKIDQSFISNLLTNRSDQILVRSTIELGHELGLKVIAEGVEDARTMHVLDGYGCDMVQGWHIARPLGVEAVEKMLEGPSVQTEHRRSAA